MKMGPINITFCGDTSLETKNGAEDPFLRVKDEFDNCDIFFLNLETVVCNNKEKHEMQTKHVNLMAHPNKLRHINNIGNNNTIRIVNIAQNHILDFGLQGLHETVRNLQESNIYHIGLKSKPSTILTVKGKRILFISGYNRYKILEKHSDIVADELDVENEIIKLKDNVDCIIISMHWGTEHVLYANPTQQKLARRFIKLGADLVVGHHPHCIQGYETYREKKIYYSLGNFNFWSHGKKNLMKNRKNIILEVEYTENNQLNYMVKPIFISDTYQPFIQPSLGILEKLEEISKFNHPRIKPLLFYQIAAKTYLKGNLLSRLFIIKKKPSKIINTLVWIACKPFNWGCYAGILVNLIADNKSNLNEWE